MDDPRIRDSAAEPAAAAHAAPLEKPASTGSPPAATTTVTGVAATAADVFATAAVPGVATRPATFPYRAGDVILPGYRLTKRLGSGGFGEVWRAEAPGGMGVAIKILANLGRREGAREYRALMTIRNIRHAHIVPLFGIWLKSATGHVLDDAEVHDAEHRLLATGAGHDAAGGPDEALESLELIVAMGLGDQTLHDRLGDAKRAGVEAIPPAELLPWMQQAALALDHFNSGSRRQAENATAVQHCDIKPQNLLLVGDVVQVCDFGLARAQGEVRATSNRMASLAYAAPEMISPPYDPSPSTDQYCLAMTYVELRTGRLPYSELTPMAIVRAKLEGGLDLAGVPAAEARVLERALAVDPAKRWQNCVEFVRALRSTARQDGIISGTVSQSVTIPKTAAAPAGAHAGWAETKAAADQQPAAPAASAAPPRPNAAAAGGRGRLLAALGAGAIVTVAGGSFLFSQLRPQPQLPEAPPPASNAVPATEAVAGGPPAGTAAAPGPTPPRDAAPEARERAIALTRQGDFLAAAAEYAVAHAANRDLLATALFALEEDAHNAGRITDCIALYERLERLYAADPVPRVKDKVGGEFTRWYVTNMLAWYLATQPAADAVAGARARRLADEALELAGDNRENRAQSLDTLAAAAARQGDWEESLRRIDAALEIANPGDEEDFRRRRASYEKHMPWSEP